jgi:GNAT superfamily N-acetyltransferase
MKLDIDFALKKDIDDLVDIYGGSKTYQSLELTLCGPDKRLWRYLIARDYDGKLLGSCSINLRFANLGAIGLENLLVKEEFRRNGIGTGLVEAVEKFAKEAGAYRIWLWSTEDRKPALALYEKRGFCLEKRREKTEDNPNTLLYGMNFPCPSSERAY